MPQGVVLFFWMQVRKKRQQVRQGQLRQALALLLAPFAPHIAEELWERLGKAGSVHAAPWPAWEEEVAREIRVTVVAQVNGKVRDRIEVSPGKTQEEMEALAMASPKVQGHLEGKTVRQVFVVADRLVNIVTD